MNSELTVISDPLLSTITGGHLPSFGTFAFAFTVIWHVLEAPHAFMGIRDFTNYSVDRWQRGCQSIDEGDHFTAYFCKA